MRRAQQKQTLEPEIIVEEIIRGVRFAKKVTDITGKVIHTITKTELKDPYGVLGVIFKTADLIYEQVQLVKANKVQFMRLAGRIKVIEESIKGLDQVSNPTQFCLALKAFQGCLERCLTFIKEFSSKHWFKCIIYAGVYNDKFDFFNQKLAQVMTDLELGLQVQQIMNREQDKEDQRKDYEASMAKQDEIIRLQQEQMSEFQNLDMKEEDRHKILVAQFESLKLWISNLNPFSQKAQQKDPIDSHYIIPFFEIAVDSVLRKGTFATIYLGRWCEQSVAIKKLEGPISEEDRKQFIREVQIMSQLRGQYITQFYGACIEPDRATLVMEYMKQGSLYDVLGQKKLTPEQQKQIALDIAKGLIYLHNKTVIHRDLKSANVLINRHGEAKLTDFGLSKIKASSVKTIIERSAAIQWMAPELFMPNGKYSEKSDIYAYGVVLWELITGKRPYADLVDDEVVSRTKQLGQREKEIDQNIPKVFADLIKQCWSRNPEDRPTLLSIIGAIEAYQIRPSSPNGEELYLRGIEHEQQQRQNEAKQAYELAITKDYCKAYTNLGLFYLKGIGINRPDKKYAYTLFKKGADKGHDRAQFNLGQMLEYGDGVEENLPRAAFWYEKAAQQGNTNAKKKLARIEEKIQERQRSVLANQGVEYQGNLVSQSK